MSEICRFKVLKVIIIFLKYDVSAESTVIRLYVSCLHTSKILIKVIFLKTYTLLKLTLSCQLCWVECFLAGTCLDFVPFFWGKILGVGSLSVLLWDQGWQSWPFGPSSQDEYCQLHHQVIMNIPVCREGIHVCNANN